MTAMGNNTLYVSFVSTGGMRHYGESLAFAARKYTETNLGLFTCGTDEQSCGSGNNHAAVAVAMSVNRWRHVLREKYNPCYYARAARHFHNTTKPSLVHITSEGTGLLAFAEYFIQHGIKVVYTVHDPCPHEENVTSWAKVVNLYKRHYQFPKLFRLLHAIHVHSEQHRDILAEIYGSRIREKTYVVQHGGGVPLAVQAGERVPVELASRKLEHDYIVLFFGRIHPYKGLVYLAEALRIARSKGCRVALIAAGQGDSQGLFAGGEGHILLINRFIDDDEVAALFNTAHAVVLPYITATQSGVVPLAYAFGKPVIATRVGALDELVIDDETGLLVPPRDPEALANALISMADQATRSRMGNAARRFLQERISWERVAEAHVKEYKKLLDK